ncbi:MAG: hypothetical protein DME03_11335 [Candidatus Rokuibacteriota bacterium]|nr:MAG: hypothetical protein DME03_11335 [Candidatus Rokubacteria bacterium]
MKALAIPSSFTTTFTLEYGVSEADLRRLYENAKRDQWNASRDIPWSAAPSSDGRVIADELIDVYGSPLWERLPEAERVALNRHIAAWRLSVLMHGEQGALLACSQMVDIVEGADAKFFQATQVVDEARHNEVLSRYLTERLDGLTYPMPANERDLFDSILSESRWYLKTIALQLVAETFAVALFKMMSESARDPVLEAICKRILLDESRHMGFGMLSLPRVVNEASPAERRGQALPPRDGRFQRLRAVPQVLQAGHARLDGREPGAAGAPHRPRPAPSREARRQPAGELSGPTSSPSRRVR